MYQKYLVCQFVDPVTHWHLFVLSEVGILKILRRKKKHEKTPRKKVRNHDLDQAIVQEKKKVLSS